MDLAKKTGHFWWDFTKHWDRMGWWRNSMEKLADAWLKLLLNLWRTCDGPKGALPVTEFLAVPWPARQRHRKPLDLGKFSTVARSTKDSSFWKEAKHGRWLGTKSKAPWRAWVLSSGQLLVPVTRSSAHISEAWKNNGCQTVRIQGRSDPQVTILTNIAIYSHWKFHHF